MEMQHRQGVQGDVPEISQFLDDNKGRVDRDPDCLAYDDLRHYAYEGDGNSGGSLSSLISGEWPFLAVSGRFWPFLALHSKMLSTLTLIPCSFSVQVRMTQIWISIICPSLVQDSRN